MTDRAIRARYVDPLAEVWLAAAARFGWTVVRNPDAYAAWDGAATLTIGSADTLDADDSLAQMIFHEACHAITQGPARERQPDWGLDNITTVDAWREHAALRLQRTLARRHGLDRFFAPTTVYREFWDALPADPLADRDDPTVIEAIAALARADRAPWQPALTDALVATADVKPEWVTVLIEEFDRENWATGGELHSDKFGEGCGSKGTSTP